MGKKYFKRNLSKKVKRIYYINEWLQSPENWQKK
jgi:hypothetical protein